MGELASPGSLPAAATRLGRLEGGTSLGKRLLGGSSHFGRWFITMVGGPLPTGRTPWLINGSDPNHLLTGMILQVRHGKC